MARWLEAWFTYYQRLYGIGFVVLLYVVGAALAAFLLAAIPIAAVAWLVGANTLLWISIAAALIGPVILGSFIRYIGRDAVPRKPPSWSHHKAGVQLPD